MRKIQETHFTKIIIDGTKIETYESDVDHFEIEVYQGTELSPGEIYIGTYNIAAKQKNDFVYQGTGELIIENLTVGEYYWFRIRTVKISGEKSSWGQWQSELAGDVTNELNFDTKTVVNTSSAVTFRVTVDTVPEDFDKFVWKVKTEPAQIEIDPNVSGAPIPGEPAAPDADVVPDFTTTAIDDISISFNESRDNRIICFYIHFTYHS